MSASPDVAVPTSPIDPKERFFRYFQHEIIALQDQINRLKDAPAGINGERNDMIEHCLAGIARLSHEVKDASSYVPTYDQRTYGEAIKALTSKLETTRQQLTPRQKFTFKSVRKNPSAISLADAAELAAQAALKPPSSTATSTAVSSQILSPIKESARSPVDERPQPEFPSWTEGEAVRPVRRPSFSREGRIEISNQSHERILLSLNARGGTSSPGLLSNLQHCIVFLTLPTINNPLPSLTLKSISSSLILAGHIDGSIHITNLSNSILLVNSTRQFRMHGSKNVDVYLHCTSRPIIEDCEGIRFAPVMTQGKEDGGMFDQVDDFKWLKGGANPHWKILPVEERIHDRLPRIGEEQAEEAVATSLRGILPGAKNTK